MNVRQTVLYEKLQGFSLDEPGAKFPFSKRLARDNQWPLSYAQRVIEEYKRFTLLAVTAGHPVTPSDQVDQVWHLHLSYTRNYWETFCPNVLQTPLHHGPTQGGSAERQKFDQWYNKTLSSYERLFNEPPPVDIWPGSQDRFDRDLNFVRVNTQQTWLIPKVKLSTVSAFLAKLQGIKLQGSPRTWAYLSVSFFLVGCREKASGLLHPLDFNGPTFLLFYTLLSCLILCLSSWIRKSLASSATVSLSDSFKQLSPYELAARYTGERHTVRTAALSLIQQGFVEIKPDQEKLALKAPIESVANPIEREVAERIDEHTRKGTLYMDAPLVSELCARARTRISTDSISHTSVFETDSIVYANLFASLPILALLCLGIAKIGVGLNRDQPVGYLTLICIFILLYSLGKFASESHPASGSSDEAKMVCNIYRGSANREGQDSSILREFALRGNTSLPQELEMFKHIYFEQRLFSFPVSTPVQKGSRTFASSVTSNGGDSGGGSGGDSCSDGGSGDGGDGGGDGGCGGCGGCGGGG